MYYSECSIPVPLKGASSLCGSLPVTFEPIFIHFSNNLCWAAQEYGSDAQHRLLLVALAGAS